MKRLFWALLPLLAACAAPLPGHDPQMAWVELYTAPGHILMAERLDGQRLNDGRYYQVTPGAHVLEMRFVYELSTGFEEPARIHCRLKVAYEGFQAGQRYLLEVRPVLRKAAAKMTDAQGAIVVRTGFQQAVCPAW